VRRLGVTGASGYIGGAVIAAAASAGWDVVALGRRPVPGVGAWRTADLATPPGAGLLDSLDAVLHLAADTGAGDGPGAGPELAFATELARQAQARAMPCVIVSSQAASAAAPSDYGRSKHAIEQATLPLSAILVRPGLVVGGREAGLFGLLCGLVRRSPLVPRLLPVPAVQPVHVDDLARALLAACSREGLAGRVIAVAGEPVGFDALLQGIARHRVRVRRWRVPVPVFAVRLLLAVAGAVAGPRLSPARLDSLTQLPPLDPRDAATRLGVTLRPLADALDRRGGPGRAWLREARALARALVPDPPPSLLRRYVRLLQANGVARPLGLSEVLLARPAWLAALDQPALRRGAASGDLAWRMGAMARLAEAEPTLAARFLVAPGQGGRLRMLGWFCVAGLRELQSRLLAPLARRQLRRPA